MCQNCHILFFRTSILHIQNPDKQIWLSPILQIMTRANHKKETQMLYFDHCSRTLFLHYRLSFFFEMKYHLSDNQVVWRSTPSLSTTNTPASVTIARPSLKG